MTNNIFDLVYSDYDWQEHYFFDGPDGATLEDFEKLCNQLMPKAGYRAALKKSAPKEGGWICWSDVVEALISLLERQGYQRVYIDSHHIDGGTIIGFNEDDDIEESLGFSAKIILNYNRKLEKKLAEERKAKRSLRLGTLKKKTVQIIK
jgi:hypothetical protein